MNLEIPQILKNNEHTSKLSLGQRRNHKENWKIFGTTTTFQNLWVIALKHSLQRNY